MQDCYGDKSMRGPGNLTRLFEWVGKHPGYVVLGTLMIAYLSMQPAAPTQNDIPDSPADDVPLFV